MPKLELRGVSKRFGKVLALDSISLSVNEGEYFCLLGPTGAGKTTTLKVISGLVKPDAGEVIIDGENVTELLPEERGASYMSQTFDLFPHLDVLSNVSYGPAMRGLDWRKAEELAIHFLKLVKLDWRAESMPSELSGGMQQRLALARALCSGASLFLFDDPLASLDAKLRTELRTELKRMAKAQRSTVIHVTHDQEEALRLSDRLAIIRNGRVIQIGTPTEVYSNPKNIFVANFIGECNFLEVEVMNVKGRRCIVSTADGVVLEGTCSSTVEEGRRAVLAVRSEDLELIRGSGEISNTFQGTIIDVRFLGYYDRITVEIGSYKLACKVLRSEADSFQFKREEKVGVRFPPESCIVYPYSEGGLLKELEVI